MEPRRRIPIKWLAGGLATLVVVPILVNVGSGYLKDWLDEHGGKLGEDISSSAAWDHADLLTAIAVGTVALIGLFLWSRSNSTTEALDVSVQIAELTTALADTDHLAAATDGMLNNSPLLVQRKGRDYLLEQLVLDFFTDCQPVFNDLVRRSSIFRPTSNKEQLIPWICDALPEASKQRTVCSISSDIRPNELRGVAGEAYVTRAIQVAHMTNDPRTKNWSCDHPQYIRVEPARKAPQYRAFAAVPLISPVYNDPLGVLCLDSMDTLAFDTDSRQQVLALVGARLGAILALYAALEEELPAAPTPD